MKIGRLVGPLLACATAACSSPPIPAASVCQPREAQAEKAYVVGEGWHTQIGLPVEELVGPLAFYRSAFPGARAIMFGYGKKTFFTAPATSPSEYVLGPFPGPAVIQVVALSVLPSEAYPADDTIVLTLPPGGAAALSAAIWDDLGKDETGKPQLVSVGERPASVFYTARSRYNLLHTCNTWVADLIHATGLNMSGDGVVFSGQVMSRTADVAIAQCTTPLATGTASTEGRNQGMTPEPRPTPQS
jgi:hypothetical protein